MTKNYDYKEAIEIMTRENVKEAQLGMLEDWGWTAEDVTISSLKKMKNGITRLAGITGSYWATPTLKIEKNNTIEEFDCYYEVVK